MSISKKLAAVVSAAAVVVSMFAAAPASAETTAAFINRTVANSVERPIDPTTHTVKFYAGEEFSLYFNANIKDSTFTNKVTASSEFTVDGGFSIQSGTVSATTSKSAYFSGQVAGAFFNVMNDRTAADLKATKTLTAAPTGVNANININGTATTDVVFVFNPSIKIDDYVLVSSDMQYSNNNASSRSGGGYNPESNGKSRVARAEDTNFNFFAETGCIKTSGLSAGDVLEHTMTISDGTSNVGTSNPYWQIKNAQGMSNGPGSEGSTFTFDGVPEGSTLSVNSWVEIATPVTGKTYTFGEVKVVKQGTTENLLTNCATTAATTTVEVVGGLVTVNIDKSGDTSNMGQKFDMYTCALYASADADRATVLKSSRGYMMAPVGGMGAPSTKCMFSEVAAGTYVVGVRGSSWNGLSDEKVSPATITVTGAVTPVKKAPKVPTIATKVKVGKTFNITLHSSKGTATKGANADGLATTVVLAASSKAYCSLTKIVKSKKITGFTVKGLKVGTSKCVVTVTVTGNSTYNSLTKVYKVSTTK